MSSESIRAALAVNATLPRAARDWCAPLAVLARAGGTSVTVARGVLCCLLPDRKTLRAFDRLVYASSSSSSDEK